LHQLLTEGGVDTSSDLFAPADVLAKQAQAHGLISDSLFQSIFGLALMDSLAKGGQATFDMAMDFLDISGTVLALIEQQRRQLQRP
jgi:hypothetical protein